MTTAVDSVRAALARLDELDLLNAVVARDDDAAIATAIALDQAASRRPLHGMAFTAKDWIDAAGLPCAGVGDDRDRRPLEDATAVARMRAAGAVLVAKTNVGVEHQLFTACRHPLDADRSPGASSSGAAALVAAGGPSLALASDSGGSIRLPAAWCGAVGLKPSFGVVPDTGHYPRVGAREDGRTVIGPITATVAEAWLVLTTIAGPDGADPGAVPVAIGEPDRVRLAGLRVASLGPVDAVAGWTVERAVDALVARGAVVADGPPPSCIDEAMDITQRYWQRGRRSGLDADRQLRDWDRFRRRLLAASHRFDVLLCPTAPGPAPRRRAMEDEDYRWTLPWSLTGWPALSLPWGRSPDGLPLAVQVVGRMFEDHVVVAAAAALEADRSATEGRVRQL